MAGENPSFFRRIMDFRRLLSEKDAALRESRVVVASQRKELAALRAAPERNSSQRGSGKNHGEFGLEFPHNAFFVIGRARSGTTWLRGILNAHPEILCWGEGRLFERSTERPELAGMEGKKITPTSLYGALGRAGYLRDWIENSVWAGNESYEDHLRDITRLCARHFMEGRLAGTGARLVGDKTPYRSAEVIGEIADVLPGAKVIHIVRDGRDAAVSFVHHSWSHASSEGGVYDLSPEEFILRERYRSGTLHPPESSLFTPERLATLATEWSRETTRVSDEGKRLLEDDYVEVRYEDLLTQPETETRRLLRFLGADSSDGAIHRCTEKTGFEKGSGGRKPGQEDPASRSRKGIAGDWKNIFTTENSHAFEEIARDALDHFGYERSR